MYCKPVYVMKKSQNIQKRFIPKTQQPDHVVHPTLLARP